MNAIRINTTRIIISLVSTLLFGAQVALAAGLPGNVTGPDATAIDATSIGLTWNGVTDAEDNPVDHYRIYYGTFSVFEEGAGEYENELDTPTNNTSYVISGLTSDTTYYFSVTGISSDNLESEEYSFEASATTLAGEAVPAEVQDTTSPTVTSVSAPDKMHVKLVFSEAVQLPDVVPEASFGIVEQINPANILTVNSATIDPADPVGMTVLLETSEQTANVNYIVTAGVAVKDLAGNPIVSGSTDSGLFLGSSVEPPAMELPAAELPAAQAEVVDCDKDLGCFVQHLSVCSAAMVKESDAEYEYKLEITGIEGADCLIKYTAEKHPNVLFSGTDMECKVVQGAYTPETYKEALSLENCDGTLVDGYVEIEMVDTTPPENITNLLLTFREQLEKFVVIMNWTASINSAKDLVDQILYMSLDRGLTYDDGKSLGSIVTNTEVANLDGGKEYTFKITTKDATGNESTGTIKSIRLPQTGVGIGLVLLGSALAARSALRRKEDDES